MNIFTEHDLQLDDCKMPAVQEQALLKSKNAMSAFVYDSTNLPALPASTYLRAYKAGRFIGAIHMEYTSDHVANIHPMLIDRDRGLFTEVTEATILWCLNTGFEPTAKVLTEPHYAYMHSFLGSLGLASTIAGPWRIYGLPYDWRPKSFTTYTMEFES